MSDVRYMFLKRLLAVLAAIALWILSIQFSVAGFAIKVPDLVWAGWVLGMAVTVIELIFTSENRGRNLTLTFLGIGAYVYGVWSNIVGISASREVDGFGVGMVFSIILGLILEIAPEPLFLWGVLGGDTGEGDIVSTLSGLWTDAQKRPVGRPKISKFPFVPDISTRSKVKPDLRDTVSKSPKDYHMATRLNIITILNNGGRLVWDKNKYQSPILTSGLEMSIPIPVSRSLVRKMVEEKALIEKTNGMIITYVLSGQEPPIIKPMFL